eukprot:3169432-Amphidinium_carterae.1
MVAGLSYVRVMSLEHDSRASTIDWRLGKERLSTSILSTMKYPEHCGYKKKPLHRTVWTMCTVPPHNLLKVIQGRMH